MQELIEEEGCRLAPLWSPTAEVIKHHFVDAKRRVEDNLQKVKTLNHAHVEVLGIFENV